MKSQTDNQTIADFSRTVVSNSVVIRNIPTGKQSNCVILIVEQMDTRMVCGYRHADIRHKNRHLTQTLIMSGLLNIDIYKTA